MTNQNIHPAKLEVAELPAMTQEQSAEYVNQLTNSVPVVARTSNLSMDADEFFAKPNPLKKAYTPAEAKEPVAAVTETPVAAHTIGVQKPCLKHFSKYRPGDLGNSDRFIDMFPDTFRYAAHIGWLTYTDGTLLPAKKGEAREAVKAMIKQMGDDILFELSNLKPLAENETDTGKIKEFENAQKKLNKALSHYETSCGEARINACLAIVATDKRIVVAAEELNADKMLLNTLSGVVDLNTGELLPHSPNYLMTKNTGWHIAPPGTPCPTWLQFLRDTQDDGCPEEVEEMLEYKQIQMAYTLSGDTSYETLQQWHGPEGGNGKSVELSIVSEAMGTYHKAVNFRTLAFRGNDDTSIPNDIAGCEGARLITVDETPEFGVFNTEVLKKLVSGKTKIPCRFLNKEFFEYESQAKIIIATNFRVKVKNDAAVWRRMHLLSYNNTFTKEKGNIDEKLLDKLREEMPAILRWAVDGIAKLQAKGIEMPVKVARDTESYKQSQDDFGSFIRDTMDVGPKHMVKTSQAFAMYEEWAKDNKVAKPLSKTDFKRVMLNKGYQFKHTKAGDHYMGIRVHQEDLDFAAA